MSHEARRAARWTVIAGAAVAINGGLFVLMNSMIERDRMRLAGEREAVTIEFLRTPIEDETRTKDRRRKPPPKPEQKDKPQARMNVADDTMELPSPVDALDIKNMLAEGGGITLGGRLIDGTLGAIGQTLLEGDLIPISKVPPQYPPAARMRDIEGFVEMMFLVDIDGSVRDVVVVRAEPPRVFERAAVAAVGRWRYQPVTQDGVPVPVQVTLTLEFELE